MKTQVLITHTSEQALSRWQTELPKHLPEHYEIVTEPGEQVSHLITWSPAPDLFTRLGGLKTCFSAAAGVDHLLGNPSLPADLPLFRLEDAGMAVQMARYVRHEVERILLRKPDYEAQQARREWIEHGAIEPVELPVGIFGFGVLGQVVAASLAREGYPVTAFRRQPGRAEQTVAPGVSVAVVGGADEWAGFLAGSKVLVLVAPLTAATRNIIDAQALAALPPGAVVINVGRGELIDTEAMIASLNSRHLSAASLDVFDVEPLPPEHPLWTMPTVRITPHVSALTLVGPAARQVARGIVAFDEGRPVDGAVDRLAGY